MKYDPNRAFLRRYISRLTDKHEIIMIFCAQCGRRKAITRNAWLDKDLTIRCDCGETDYWEVE